MKLTRLIILLAFLVALGPSGLGQEGTSAVPAETDPAVKTDDQLEVNKDTLLNGLTEDIRVTAATIMLSSPSPAARQVLIDILRKTDNPGARAAICKGLNQSRRSKEVVPNQEDFVQPLLGILRWIVGLKILRIL